MQFKLIFLVTLFAIVNGQDVIPAKKGNYSDAIKSIASLMSLKPGDVKTATQTTDFSAVEKVYRTNFRVLVKLYGMGVEEEIDSAFTRAKRGEDVKTQKQWIEKSLQRVIYHTALKFLDRIPADKGAPDSVAALLACLETVMDRRTKWVNTPFKEQINQALLKLKKASPEEARLEAGNIRNIMTRVYLLSVLWEMRGLSTAQAKKDGSSAGKKVEGTIYFNVLAPAIKDSIILKTLASEWNKSPDAISVPAIRDGLSRGLPEQWKELPDSVRSK